MRRCACGVCVTTAGRSWKQFRVQTQQRLEFLQMQGPRGLGNAEMAVSVAEAPAAPTTTAAPAAGFDAKGFFKRISSNTISALSKLQARRRFARHD